MHSPVHGIKIGFKALRGISEAFDGSQGCFRGPRWSLMRFRGSQELFRGIRDFSESLKGFSGGFRVLGVPGGFRGASGIPGAFKGSPGGFPLVRQRNLSSIPKKAPKNLRNSPERTPICGISGDSKAPQEYSTGSHWRCGVLRGFQGVQSGSRGVSELFSQPTRSRI